MAKTLLTIILNWRTADMTLRSAEAALREMAGISGALTIVDNDSGDGSYEKIRAVVVARGWDKGEIPVRVLQSGHNGGFGAGNNAGIRAGLPGGERPDYIYILNSDAFPDPGAICKLLEHMEAHPKLGFAGSYIHGDDGAPHRTAFRFPSALGDFEAHFRYGPVSRLLRRKIVAQPIPQVTTRVDWLAGASMMMRREVLDEIGLFDETFFLYFEETELCHRAAMAGHPTDYVRDSSVTHIGSVSTGMKTWQRMPEYWFDSRAWYYTRTRGKTYWAIATISMILGASLWRLRMLIQHKDRRDPPMFLLDLIRHSLRGLFKPTAPTVLKVKPAATREGV